MDNRQRMVTALGSGEKKQESVRNEQKNLTENKIFKYVTPLGPMLLGNGDCQTKMNNLERGAGTCNYVSNKCL